jgi:serine/threonine kinase 32
MIAKFDRDGPIQLLERKTVKRLGCKPNGEGFREFSQLPWFENLDWVELEAKRLPTPFVPDVRESQQSSLRC